MKGFAKLIGKLPFAGKMSIRPLIFALYQSTTREKRLRSYALVMVLLVFFVLLHYVQMQMGIRALCFDSPIWAKVISALYATANACVVLIQVYLGFRATHFFFTAPLARKERSYVGFSYTEAATMLAVTVGGQIAFLVPYLLYQ